MATVRRFHYLGDRELVAIAQMGSLEACDELTRRYRRAALLVAEQVLGCREAAHDVAQEALLRAFHSLPTLQDPDKFGSWLYAITRNRARRVAATEGRSQPTETDGLDRLLQEQGALADSPLENVLRREEQAAIRALLADLSPEIQIVLQLFYYEQWPTSHIADFLALPLTTVKWRLHTGRARLSPRLAALLEETPDGRSREQAGDTPRPHHAAENDGNGSAGRTDRQLRKRRPQLCEAL